MSKSVKTLVSGWFTREMFGHLRWALAQAFRTAPHLVAGLVILSFLEGIGPAFVVYVSKNLIDETVTRAGGGQDALWHIVPWVGAYFAASVLSFDIMYRLRMPLSERLRQKLNYSIDQERLALAAALPLIAFEDGKTYDLLQRSDGPGGKIDGLLHHLMWAFENAVKMISLSLFFAVLSPWIPPLLIAIQIPVLYFSGKGQKLWLDLTYNQTEEQRKAGYLDGLLNGRGEQKELRVFGLKSTLVGKWRRLRSVLRKEALVLRKKIVMFEYPGGTLSIVTETAILLLAANMLSHQKLTAGLFVALFQGVSQFHGACVSFAFGFRETIQGTGEIGFVRQFLALQKELKPPGEGSLAPSFPKPLQQGVSFDGVHFRYPGREPLLRGVSFRLIPGEHVALVGENGSGKSTIAKLLTGLYTPESGTVRADEHAYDELDPASWRDNVTAAFQDFSSFEFTLAQSIAAGDPRLLGPDGWTPDLAAVQRAASLGGANEVAAELAGGWSQPIGYTMDGGVGLSGGQWQRIALSRVLIRSAQVLIMDEPTASLDPKAEAELYTRFMEIMRQHTVVVISHRLGSARMADRILVLKDGEILEEGHHDDLVKVDGEYARMWKEQAQWYQ